MVLDEDALEAMLRRGNDGEQGPLETVTTDQTDEYEVYERKEAPEADHEPEAAHERAQETPTGAPPGPVAATPDAPDADYEEFAHPGSEDAAPAPPARTSPGSATDPASSGSDPDPGMPPRKTPAPPADETAPGAPEPPTPAGGTDRGVPAHAAPPHDAAHHTPTPPDGPAFRPEPAAAPETRRRPQVWPPVSSRRDGAPHPATTEGDAEDPAAARPLHEPKTPTQEPARPDTDATATGEATDPAPRTHSPTGHAVPAPAASGSGCRLAVVQALFNQELTDMMADLAVNHARKRGAHVTRHVTVPGVFDLPLMTERMAESDDVDAVVVIGCVVQGQTRHDELITHATAKTLQEVALATGKPIGFGVTGPGMTWDQAEARVVSGRHAVEAALAQWQTLQQA